MQSRSSYLKKKAAVAASIAGSGGLGYLWGNLKSADAKALIDRVLDGISWFVRDQGTYVAYALVMAACFGGFGIWAINKLLDGKQAEIDRLVEERDKFQKPFIDNWKSTRKK